MPEAAAAGALTGFGLDAARQGIKQIETGKPGFDFNESLNATLFGAALGPVAGVEKARVVLAAGGAALGLGSAHEEAGQGNYATATFDLALGLLPAAHEIGPRLPLAPKVLKAIGLDPSPAGWTPEGFQVEIPPMPAAPPQMSSSHGQGTMGASTFLATRNGPGESGEEGGSAERVRAKVEEMRGEMSEGERQYTTFAAAEVTTADGAREMWVAAAGKKGYVPPRIAGDARVVVSPAKARHEGLPHINDAERALARTARRLGATIDAVGATRLMCAHCQAVYPKSSIATPRK